MYKGKYGHVKELLLAFQELRQASCEMSGAAIDLRNLTGGKENKEQRKKSMRLITQLEERSEIFSRRAYYFKSLAHEHLKKVLK